MTQRRVQIQENPATVLIACTAKIAGAIAMLTACGTPGYEADLIEVGQAQKPIQRDYVTSSQTGTGRWANLLRSESVSAVGKATGAIYGLTWDATRLYSFNCGATFISPQYAYPFTGRTHVRAGANRVDCRRGGWRRRNADTGTPNGLVFAACA
jgi:hypothetical protein